LHPRGIPAIRKGDIIEGLEAAKKIEGVTVFHAGTSFSGSNIVTNGGRVLGVTALGDDIRSAKVRAYEAIERYISMGCITEKT